ncbi:hypothetical protein SKP52_02380 [Sphingopyxis fribergensis]|uniref:Uncharacterized protein n=1 Tax=Sphingopyxis fribergensis TaxID=1515612 RepID=A0A0A7PBD1_9SPHN|nr:hypothetical protein [Sphingopyxis fribergensis]AJA07411.1 hypothetical protein SKP52_02380 [Sphingopyxis fribergensis]
MIALALKALGLMRVSEHERIKNAEILRYTRLNDSLRNERNDAQDKFQRAATDLAALDVTEWSSHIGDPPDGDSPLLCVYDAGIGYAYDRLAEWLGVDDYEMGDGSEEYATDVGRTGANVLVAAGFTNDDGDLLGAAELNAMKHDAQKWRDYLKRSRDRKAGKKNG